MHTNKWFMFGLFSAAVLFSGVAIAETNSGNEFFYSNKEGHVPLDNDLANMSMDKEDIYVNIDVLPEDDQNQFAASNADLEVALLGSAEFNVGDVELNSLMLNDTAYQGQPMMADTNDDGQEDLIIVFAAKDLDLKDDTTKLTLKGKTKDGKSFSGSDNVSVTQ